MGRDAVSAEKRAICIDNNNKKSVVILPSCCWLQLYELVLFKNWSVVTILLIITVNIAYRFENYTFKLESHHRWGKWVNVVPGPVMTSCKVLAIWEERPYPLKFCPGIRLSWLRMGAFNSGQQETSNALLQWPRTPNKTQLTTCQDALNVQININ